MASIKQLPESVWTRIAAGEVVERPASAVKELIENSLDAGAKRVRVRLWDGGRLRIVAEDDGHGIAFDELPMALTPHATSKISDIADLDGINTLGYRGEALASLVSVASVEIRSRCGGETGGVIRTRDGRIIEHSAASCTNGTRVQVDELFGNFPARRKFMKSAAGELRRVASCVRDYAVCRPDVAFSLEHDGRELLSVDGGGDVGRVLAKFWGAEQPIMSVSAKAAHLSLECRWQGRPARGDVMAFVNGRAVNDPIIKGAVSAVGARELSGNWALFFTLDPSLIDVNIHPAKAEVRFRYSGEVFEILRIAAAQLGSAGSLTPGVAVKMNCAAGAREAAQGRFPTLRNAASSASEIDMSDVPRPSGMQGKPQRGDKNIPSAMYRKWDIDGENAAFPRVPYVGSKYPPNGGVSQFSNIEPPLFERTGAPVTAAPSENDNLSSFLGGEASASPSPQGENIPYAVYSSCEQDVAADDIYAQNLSYMGQTSSGYLIFDLDGEIIIMDPHAAHERVNYERIRSAAGSENFVQHLLLPVPLPPTLSLEALEYRELAERCGFTISEEDGGVFLRSVPSLSSAAGEPEAMFRAALSVFRSGGDDINEALWRTLATMACKASVKLTSRLSRDEAEALWRALHECEQPYFCPHGRPVMLRIGPDELLKRFGRE